MPIDPRKLLLIAGAASVVAGCNTTREADNRARALAMAPPASINTPAEPLPQEVTGSISVPSREAADDRKPLPPEKPAQKVVVLPGDEPEAEPAPRAQPAAQGRAAAALAAGRERYRNQQFREAETQFRRATVSDPGNAEAWLGLAASYDRMNNFAEADRAYAKARAITGTTAEMLNNQGYSYLLRGDLKRARETLQAAQKLDPSNKYVENNLVLLDHSERKSAAKR